MAHLACVDIDPTLITKGFKKCCLTNALDGTEDDILWQDDDDNNTDTEPDGTDEDFYYHNSDIIMFMPLEDVHGLLFEESDDEEIDGF